MFINACAVLPIRMREYRHEKGAVPLNTVTQLHSIEEFNAETAPGAGRQLPTTYLSTARGKWLEIVHEDNVSNDFRINIKVWYIPLLYGRSFADFGLGGFRLSCARQWAATLLVVPARFFATAVRRLRRKWSK